MKTISLKKKVAAVAVASLGLGLLSVAPAKAATVGTTTMTTPTASVAVGAVASSTFSVTTVGATASDTITYSYAITRKPSDSGLAKTGATTTTSATPASGIAKFVAGTETTDAKYARTLGTDTMIDTIQASPTELNSVRGTIALTPDKPGIYVITVTSTVAVGSSSTSTATFTVYAGYNLNSTYANRAFPTQGSNTTTGWAATAGGQGTVRITGLAASTTYWVTLDKGSIIAATERDNASDYIDPVVFTNGTNFSGGFKFTTDASATTSEAMDVTITDTGSPTTSTVTVVTYDASTGAATTFVTATVTWGVASAPSAQYSLLTLNTTTGTTATGAAADTTATVAANTANTQRFNIMVTVKDQYDVAFNGSVVGASISGPGTLGLDTDVDGSANSTGRSITATFADNAGQVSVYSDGTSGKATITITATTAAGVTTVLGTKTVTFAGSPATATVSQNLFVAQAGAQLGATAATSTPAATSVATTAALRATVKDANGVAVTSGRTVRIVSSDSAVIVAGACAELTVDGDADVAGSQATPGVFECAVSGATGAASGKTATITFEVQNATTGLYDVKATPITFKIGGAIAAVAVSFDKATYTPGAAMNLTATATDSAGNAAYDGQAPYASIAGNMAVGGSLPGATKQIVNGKLSTTGAAATLFAPANSGTYTVSGLTIGTATDPAGKAWSASATIAGSAEIASIQTQMTALVAAIAKLQKAINKINKRLNR